MAKSASSSQSTLTEPDFEAIVADGRPCGSRIHMTFPEGSVPAGLSRQFTANALNALAALKEHYSELVSDFGNRPNTIA